MSNKSDELAFLFLGILVEAAPSPITFYTNVPSLTHLVFSELAPPTSRGFVLIPPYYVVRRRTVARARILLASHSMRIIHFPLAATFRTRTNLNERQDDLLQY